MNSSLKVLITFLENGNHNPLIFSQLAENKNTWLSCLSMIKQEIKFNLHGLIDCMNIETQISQIQNKSYPRFDSISPHSILSDE